MRYLVLLEGPAATTPPPPALMEGIATLGEEPPGSSAQGSELTCSASLAGIPRPPYRQAAALTRNAGERTTFRARAHTELALVPLQDSGSCRSGPDIEFTQ
jgi:hypothetical protein